MNIRVLVLPLLILSIMLPYHVTASSINYEDYEYNGIRVVVVDARTPSYSFEYCGTNYIDLNMSNDYAVWGPQGIPGIEEKPSAKNPDINDRARVYEKLRKYRIPPDNALLTDYILSVRLVPEYGAIEVRVKHDTDPVSISRHIAAAISSIMHTLGYNTLIIIRPVSDMTPGELSEVFNKISSIVLGAVNEPPNDAPPYLQKIIKLQRTAIENSTLETYISIGLGVYGSVGIELWGPQPTLKEAIELAKWIRDKTGECTTPLYIEYNGPHPRTGTLLEPKTIQTTQDTPESNTTTPNTILPLTTALIIALTSITLLKTIRS